MFAIAEIMSATARPRSPIAQSWVKISSHSAGHRKSRILPNQKICLPNYSRKEAHSFRLIKKLGLGACTFKSSHEMIQLQHTTILL